MDTDVRDATAGTDEFRAELEGIRHADRFDRNVGTDTPRSASARRKHESAGLEIGVYVLVAPEPDHQHFDLARRQVDLREKLRLQTRAQLVRYALSQGLLGARAGTRRPGRCGRHHAVVRAGGTANAVVDFGAAGGPLGVDTLTVPQLLKLVAQGRLDPTPFVTHRLPLGETMAGYDAFAAAAETHALKVVLEAEPVASSPEVAEETQLAAV